MRAALKPAPSAVELDADPIWQAALHAPLGRPETPEELELLAAAEESEIVPSAEVRAMLARRRPAQ